MSPFKTTPQDIALLKVSIGDSFHSTHSHNDSLDAKVTMALAMLKILNGEQFGKEYRGHSLFSKISEIGRRSAGDRLFLVFFIFVWFYINFFFAC
jgi:hypothetical protein